MEMLKKNNNGIFERTDDFEIVGVFNPNIDFYFNGLTHKISKEYSDLYDYGIVCFKDKSKIVSSLMTLDLRRTKEYFCTPQEIIDAYKRRQI